MKSCILVVEDNPEFDATSETDSGKAAELLTRNKYDAVFLDMQMPPPDGLELPPAGSRLARQHFYRRRNDHGTGRPDLDDARI